MKQFLNFSVIAGCSCLIANTLSAQSSPNVIMFMVDDLGYSDLSCYGSTYYETPNIDKLAKTGVKFTCAYAACSVSSPTRASILTGKYPGRLHITHAIPIKGYARINEGKGTPFKDADYCFNLPLSELTIAEALKAHGYVTANLGKWHVSETEECSPIHQGFDINLGGDGHGSTQNYFYPYHNRWRMAPGYPYREWNALPDGKKGEYITDRLTDEAVSFIRDNRKKPFFLLLSHFAVHTPLQAHEDLIAKYDRKPTDRVMQHNNATYAAMIESVDKSMGRVLNELKRNGLEDNTIIIFTSDNGGQGNVTSNYPWRGNKGNFYEGGIRIPLIVKAPGINHAICNHPVITTDYYPTILDLAGYEQIPEQHVDGQTIVPLLKGKTIANRDLFWHFPNYIGAQHPDAARPLSVIRSGKYKLIESLEDGSVQLFNLEKDSLETTDLSESKKGIVRKLKKKLRLWRTAASVQMPEKNENYNPSLSISK